MLSINVMSASCVSCVMSLNINLDVKEINKRSECCRVGSMVLCEGIKRSLSSESGSVGFSQIILGSMLIQGRAFEEQVGGKSSKESSSSAQ